MRNGSLWSNVVFEKEVIFHKFDFETLDLELIWGLEIKHQLESIQLKGCFFLSLLSRNFDKQLSSIFYKLVILCIQGCWDIPRDKTSHWQLPIVTTAFKAMCNGAQQLANFLFYDFLGKHCCFHRLVWSSVWCIWNGWDSRDCGLVLGASMPRCGTLLRIQPEPHTITLHIDQQHLQSTSGMSGGGSLEYFMIYLFKYTKHVW